LEIALELARSALATLLARGSRSKPGATRGQTRWSTKMNLAIWLPGMFILGLAAMGLCYAFLLACEKI